MNTTSTRLRQLADRMGLDGFAEELREIAGELEAKAAPAVAFHRDGRIEITETLDATVLPLVRQLSSALMGHPVERAAPAVPRGNDPAWTLAAKVREALDRKACPSYYMDVAVEAVVHNYATAAPSQEPVTLTDGLIEKGAMTGMVDAQIDSIIAALREKQAKATP